MDDLDVWTFLLDKSFEKTIVVNDANEKIILDTKVYCDRPVLGKIVVLPMYSLEDFLPTEKWAGISITDPNLKEKESPKITSDNLCELLSLKFEDLSKELPGRTLFTPSQAQQIWDFVGKVWESVDLLMIHCHAGLARSPAVAKAISCRYQPEFANYYDQLYSPNPLVFNRMMDKIVF